MIKMTRLAAWAMVLLIAMPAVLVPVAALAQAQSPSPAAPAASQDSAPLSPAPPPTPAAVSGGARTTEIVENLPANHVFTVREGKGVVSRVPFRR